MTPRAILIAARASVATPETWTKGAYALDADGAAVAVESASAARFCMVGALSNVTQTGSDWSAAYRVLARVTDCPVLSSFNDADSTTHADVLAAFDRAIAIAEAES